MEQFLKFLAVGGFGFIINTAVLLFGVKKLNLRPSIAGPIGAEIAIMSNFFWNNIWTFSDKAITSWDVIPLKFLQFNALSFGSVAIQFAFLKTGEKIFGLAKFKEPFIDNNVFKNLPVIKTFIPLAEKIPFARKFTLYLIFYMFGVGVGLLWNFTMYTLVIWR